MIQRILVLDDEENYAEMLKAVMEQHYFVVDTATRAEMALDLLQNVGHALVISDFKMPVMDGANFLESARKIIPDLPFILVSGLMNTPELVKVANMGVTLVLEKPIDPEVFISTVRKFAEPLTEEEFKKYQNSQSSSDEASEEAPLVRTYPEETLKYLPGMSHTMKRFLQGLWEKVQEGSDFCVAYTEGGEIELVLRQASLWKRQPTEFIHFIDAADLGSPASQTLFEGIRDNAEASNLVGITGLGALSAYGQEKLVKFIENPGEVIPAAATASFVFFVEESLLQGEGQDYHVDLLHVFSDNACHLPPLKERLADVAYYIDHYLSRYTAVMGLDEKNSISPEAVEVLLSHSWPGNFRELTQVLRRVASLSLPGQLGLSEIRSVFRRLQSEVPHSLHGLSLTEELRTKQNAILAEIVGRSEESLAEILSTLKLPDSVDTNVAVAEDLALLFPDLIQE